MAKGALAAGAVFASFSAARQAVNNTEDLAKSTIFLNRSLGLSVKTASEWAAVAKVRGIETRSLNMAFATLSRNTVAAAQGGEKQRQAFRALGVSVRDVHRGTRDFDGLLHNVARGFGNVEGGAKRTAVAQKLLGRGWQTLLPLFAQGEKSLKEQLRLADKYGITFGGKSLKSIKQLIAAEREMKFAQLGLQMSFTKNVAPVLIAEMRLFGNLTRKINEDVVPALVRVERIVGRSAQGWQALGRNIRDMAIGDLNLAIGGIREFLKVYNAIPLLPDAGLPGKIKVPRAGKPKPRGPGGPGGIKARAKGGPAHGWAVVGEEGPELAYFSKPAQILSNPVSKRVAPALGVPGFAGGTLSKSQIAALWVQAGGSRGTANTAASIALAESGGRVGAHGDVSLGGSWGLWQVHHPSHPGYSVDKLRSDPLYNARAAVSISGGGKNFNPWTQYREGVYKQYLDDPYSLEGGDIPVSRGGGRGAEKMRQLRQRQRERRKRLLSRERRRAQRRAERFKTRRGRSLADLSPWAQPSIDDLERGAAMAALTPGPEDDIAQADRAVSIWNSLLTLAQRKKSPGAIAEAAQGLKTARDNRADLSPAAVAQEENNDLLREQNELLKQQIGNQKSLFNVSQSQYATLAEAIAAVASGQIGGKLGLAFQSPSFAGGVARH